jgi:hypothetical protein
MADEEHSDDWSGDEWDEYASQCVLVPTSEPNPENQLVFACCLQLVFSSSSEGLLRDGVILVCGSLVCICSHFVREPDALFSSLPGVLSTIVGYTGGTKV